MPLHVSNGTSLVNPQKIASDVNAAGEHIQHFSSPDTSYGPFSITAADAVNGANPLTGALLTAAPTANSFVASTVPGGDSAWIVQITGTLSGAYWLEGSLDSTNGSDGSWFALVGRQTGVGGNTLLVSSATVAGVYRGNAAGIAMFRVRNSGGGAGPANVRIRYSSGVGPTFLNAGLPAGTALIGQTRLRQPSTYSAFYRLATRPYPLSFAMTANSRKQYATLFHAATATRVLRLRRVRVAVMSISAAAIIAAEVTRLTAATIPATGAPAITTQGHSAADAAAESTALALPGTGGTEANATSPYHSITYQTAAATPAIGSINPPTMTSVWQTLFMDDLTSVEDALVIPAGTAGGFAVVLDSNAAATVTALVQIDFTEETT